MQMMTTSIDAPTARAAIAGFTVSAYGTGVVTASQFLHAICRIGSPRDR